MLCHPVLWDSQLYDGPSVEIRRVSSTQFSFPYATQVLRNFQPRCRNMIRHEEKLSLAGEVQEPDSIWYPNRFVPECGSHDTWTQHQPFAQDVVDSGGNWPFPRYERSIYKTKPHLSLCQGSFSAKSSLPRKLTYISIATNATTDKLQRSHGLSWCKKSEYL